MNWIDGFAQNVGYVVLAAGGGMLALVLVVALWFFTGYVGAGVFERLRRIYHLRVIGYWLDRLEKGGVRVFEKAEQYDKSRATTGQQP